jgi:hypothetical protein
MLYLNSIDESYIPQLPFPDFKWKWACLQCTEGINDPVVLLGVLFRMAKLEGRYKYSSEEFAKELIKLSKDLEGTNVNVDLERRVGERNIIRNSGQYWKALNLIPIERTHGVITLTPFGRKVANHVISQTEFSAETIISFKLPNRAIQDNAECLLWNSHHLEIHPLKLILSIIYELSKINVDSAYITPEELTKIVIPMSGTSGQLIGKYAAYILAYRQGVIDISKWPNCCIGANDFRIAREFLLFLSNYGYLIKNEADDRQHETYVFNFAIENEIVSILNTTTSRISQTVISETERKIVSAIRTRPNQARFRKDVLTACKRCVITNVEMPEVLEAAHIMPYKYNGPDTVDNGFAMRMDIHFLFDSGHLRISEDGDVFLSEKARWSYGATIPPKIFIPDYVNKDHIRWRWDNYNGA